MEPNLTPLPIGKLIFWCVLWITVVFLILNWLVG